MTLLPSQASNNLSSRESVPLRAIFSCVAVTVGLDKSLANDHKARRKSSSKPRKEATGEGDVERERKRFPGAEELEKQELGGSALRCFVQVAVSIRQDTLSAYSNHNCHHDSIDRSRDAVSTHTRPVSGLSCKDRANSNCKLHEEFQTREKGCTSERNENLRAMWVCGRGQRHSRDRQRRLFANTCACGSCQKECRPRCENRAGVRIEQDQHAWRSAWNLPFRRNQLSKGRWGRSMLVRSALLLVVLCGSCCGGVGGAHDDMYERPDEGNDTDHLTTIEMQVHQTMDYPPPVNSARSGRQTVDDLIFNHFLIHSLGGGGWWWGRSAGAGGKRAAQDAVSRQGESLGSRDGSGGSSVEDGMLGVSILSGEDPTCSQHHHTIRAANFDHNASKTHTCAQKAARRLWRSRYLLGEEVRLAEDEGGGYMRLAKDYAPRDCDGCDGLPGALRLIKFVADARTLKQEWARQHSMWRAFPELVLRPVEALEALGGDGEVPDGKRALSCALVLDGGQPLLHVIAEHDKGMGMDRALAVHILQEVEAGVRAVLAAGYALDGLTPAHIMMQNGRVKLFDARMSLVVDKSVREEDDSGNSAYTSQADASDHESPLCLPEQSFGVGAGTHSVWAFKNMVYLMMARPGNKLFACQRVLDDNLHRASVTLQTSRLYLLQIRVRSGPAWLPDPGMPSDTILI